jgi:hypothetical protein
VEVVLMTGVPALSTTRDALPRARVSGQRVSARVSHPTRAVACTLERRLLLAAALCATLALAACGSGRTTPPARTPQPTRIAATPGDTRLCSVISRAEFVRVTGLAATQVTPGVTTDSLTSLREVYCLYLDNSDPRQLVGRGTINFEIAADASAASRIFQTVKASFTDVSAVPGVGDAAFAGTPGGAGTGTGLVVVHGALLLYLSTGEDALSLARTTVQLAKLVLGRVTAAGG